MVCVDYRDSADDVISTIRAARQQHRRRYPGRAHSVNVYGTAPGLLSDVKKMEHIQKELNFLASDTDGSNSGSVMRVPDEFLIRPMGVLYHLCKLLLVSLRKLVLILRQCSGLMVGFKNCER